MKQPQDHKSADVIEVAPASAQQDAMPADEERLIEYEGVRYTVRPAMLVLDGDVSKLFADISDGNSMSGIAGLSSNWQIFSTIMPDDCEKFRADQIERHGFFPSASMTAVIQATGGMLSKN